MNRMDDPNFFKRYLINRMEQENATYDEGDILFAVKHRETKAFPDDWDKKCHLEKHIIGDPDDPTAPDLFPFSIHAVCGANYYLEEGIGKGSYLFLILERCLKLDKGIEIIGKMVTCSDCAGKTILNSNARLFANGAISVIPLPFPQETLQGTKEKLEAIWQEHLILPHPQCESDGHRTSFIGNPYLCQRCGHYGRN